MTTVSFCKATEDATLGTRRPRRMHSHLLCINKRPFTALTIESMAAIGISDTSGHTLVQDAYTGWYTHFHDAYQG